MNDSFFDQILYVSLMVLLTAAALTLYRLFKGPLFADRVIALDLLGMILVAAMLVFAVLWRQPVYLDAVPAFVMVAFLGTVGLARYLEQRGHGR